MRRCLLAFSLVFWVGWATPAHALKIGSLELQGGTFGLFNLNDSFTKASPTLGVTPAFEWKLSKYFALGAESMFVWIKSVKARHPRFVWNPHLRGRILFDVKNIFTVDVTLALGLTLWPENDSEDKLDPEIGGTRVGWSLRAAFGLTYPFKKRFAFFGNLGYMASTSYGNGISATHDTMLLSLGIRFYI